MTRDQFQFRVIPFDIVGCDGHGPTLQEAAEDVRSTLQQYLTAKTQEFILLVPPVVDMDAIKDGSAIRVEVLLP